MANNFEYEIFITALKRLGVGTICFLILFIICFLSGCKTQYIPVESVRTESIDRTAEVHIIDSITDTRFVYVKGDTIVAWRDRVKWREHEVHDTIFIEKTDSIRVPYPVERQLSKWEKIKMDYGGFAMAVTIVAVAFLLIYLLRFCCFYK